MKKEFYIDIFFTTVVVHVVEDVNTEIQLLTGCGPGDADAYAWESKAKNVFICNAMFKYDADNPTVVHESVHVANIIMNRLCMKADFSNDEVQAYLTAYVYEKISNIIVKANEQKARSVNTD